MGFFDFTDFQKVGIMLTTFGGFFFTMGILLLLDRGLMAIGNLLFLTGVTLLIGPAKTVLFFFQKRKIKGTVCFLGGIVLLLFGWTFIGLLVEVFGFINLFGDFFPVVLNVLRRMPLIGTVLNLPVLRHVIDGIIHGGRLPV